MEKPTIRSFLIARNILATRKHPGFLKSTGNYVRDHFSLMDRLQRLSNEESRQARADGEGGDGGGRDRPARSASEQGT